MILFLNHKAEKCGVYQVGKRIGLTLSESKEYQIIYFEISNELEYRNVISAYFPEAVIYNYRLGTMPWLNPSLIQDYRTMPHICLFYEVQTNMFDYYIHYDPTFIRQGKRFGIGRLILEYSGAIRPLEITTIGTFGFGLEGKNYDKLAEKVNREFDEALIRMHIPFAQFGDSDGSSAMRWVRKAVEQITKPGIQMLVTHDFLSEDELLDFLAGNTINAFHYDALPGRGIASVTDYALAVDRPIAITKSNMFKHLYFSAPEICMEDHTLPEIIAAGTKPLEQFRVWNKKNFIRQFEDIYDSIKDFGTD